MRSYEQIAYLLLLMLKTSGKSRFRLSRKSLQMLSGRDVIRTALIAHIGQWLEGTAVILPLNRGGFAVISQESLEGIAPLKVGDVLPHWRQITLEQLRKDIDPSVKEEDE